MPEIQEEQSVRTKLPTDLDEEQPFISVSEVKLSLRQILTIISGATIWITLTSLTESIIGLAPLLAGIMWCWIFLGSVFFAMVKKDGLPYEEYMAQRIVFMVSERKFVLQDEGELENTQDVDETDWQNLEDPYNFWGGEK